MIKESFALRSRLPINSLPTSIRGDKLISANGTSDPFIGIAETRVFISETQTSF
jgi:hypothetical protein